MVSSGHSVYTKVGDLRVSSYECGLCLTVMCGITVQEPTKILCIRALSICVLDAELLANFLLCYSCI